jgi:ADP-ribose pyrophosphatase
VGEPADDLEVLARGRHVRLVRRGSWEYADRPGCTAIVMIVALTDDDRLVLVEQPRPPLDRTVIEVPAGLVGDEDAMAHEAPADAARRELEEETGYRAGRLEPLGAGATSPGITDEMVEVFLARGLRRVGAGGGTGGERIEVHLVALDELDDWLVRQRRRGAAVDLKVYAAAHFARRHDRP